MLDINFSQYVIDNSKHYNDKVAIIDDDNTITYIELSNHIRRFAQLLKNDKINSGDRVLILLSDSIEWAVAYLSCVYIGAVPVIGSVGSSLATIEYDIKWSTPSAVIVDNILPFCARQYLKKDILFNGSELEHYHNYDPNEMLHWWKTSGTTGTSKFVVHRHANIANMIRKMQAFDNICHSDVSFSVAKLGFCYGQVCLFTALSIGATSILTQRLPARRTIKQIIKKYSVTHLYTTPSVLIPWIKDNVIPGDELDTVRMLTSAGEVLPTIVIEKFKRLYNIDVLNHLGMTECMHMLLSQTPTNKRPGTLGKPLPGVECQIRRDDGQLCEIGEVGTLYVKDSTASGFYWNDWDATKITYVGEWIRSGDLVYVDDFGDFVYVARANGVVKVKGEYLYPPLIENALLTHCDIADAVATMTNNSFGLPEIKVSVVPINDTLTIGNIRLYLAKTLNKNYVPKVIEIVTDIPKTLTNKKIRYRR
jgi:benzoate-CoA ligase